MKRCWIGAAFLLVLLICGLLVSWAMEAIHSPIEADLDQAAQCALLGDWENGSRFFRRAWEQWETWDHFRACFADHTPTEEISAGLRALEVYCLRHQEADFAAGCRELARKAAAIGDAHGLNLWNLF